MNKKLQTLSYKVDSSERVGAFTIVRISGDNGVISKGISRKSKLDRDNKDLGIDIAKGRALKALYIKKQNQKVRHPFMD